MNIDEAKAGRELDCRVATIMGWKLSREYSREVDWDGTVYESDDTWLVSPSGETALVDSITSTGKEFDDWDNADALDLPYLSTDNGDALTLLDSPKLGELGFVYINLFFDSVIWCCELKGDRTVLGQSDLSNPSLALAICRAVLKAVELTTESMK